MPQFERGKGLHGFPKHTLVLRKTAARGHGAEAASPAAAALLARCEEHRQAQCRARARGGAAPAAGEAEEE